MTLHRITTVDELRSYLHAALQLEHATIPVYLTALYSIRPGTNADAVRTIRVVLVEEMLHLTLAANILNAVGGTVDLTDPGFVPVYPTALPDGETDFEVSIQPFGREAIETFCRIERPARPEGDRGLVERERHDRALVAPIVVDDTELHFYSIGEFYQEISDGLHRLHDEMGPALFSGDPSRQATSEYYYSGGGELMAVADLESADAAIRLISEQGEGAGGAIYDYQGELAHYYRFQQLLLGRYYQPGDEADHPSGPELSVDWEAAYPAKVNAALDDYPEGSELRAAAQDFSRAYRGFLAQLTEAFSGHPDKLYPAVGAMFEIKELAGRIIKNPIPGRDGAHGSPIYQPQPATEA